MAGSWRLNTLPTEILILIFDYCHAFDLVRLSEVCTRFYDIVREETLWAKKSKQPIVTNQISRKFRERCNPLLCLRKKWHVSHNWQYGRYEKRIIFSQKTKFMPWIQLTNDTLWWSGGSQLCCFKRVESMHKSTQLLFGVHVCSDTCKFIVRNECIVTGHRDGSIKFWTKPRSYKFIDLDCKINRAHNYDINGIDKTREAIISGSGDGTVKVWRPPVGQNILNVPLTTINITDRVWSLSADPMGKKVAVGSAGNNNCPPLHIFDLECYSQSDILKYNWQRGAGILDMIWDNPQILLTCGYDTYIRKWDLRTGTCVCSWSDPTNATVYCLSSDYRYSMISGTQFNCKAVLWDQRQEGYIQIYFMDLCRMTSPVYCLSFDSTHLYGAMDQHLVEFTFSGYSYKKTNYKEILKY